MMWGNWNSALWMPAFMRENIQLLIGLAILEFVLKGFALWRASRANQLYWFIAILVLNTAGVLPAVYLLITKTSKKKK